MAVQTLYTAATGMEAMETKLNVIANNLANVSTTGFKRGRVNFEDLFYQHDKVPGAEDASGAPTPVGISIGLGTRVQSIQNDFEQGSIQVTGNQLDVAIEGRGFLEVNDANGDIYYTRAGNLTIDPQSGNLVVASAGTSRALNPPVAIQQDATDITISADGTVSARIPGTPGLTPQGNIQMVQFINDEGLLKVGENLYVETLASGTPTTGTPGLDGLGKIRQSSLELSNVEPVEELIDLITTQRSFELNSEAVRAGDQMLQLVGSLRRF